MIARCRAIARCGPCNEGRPVSHAARGDGGAVVSFLLLCRFSHRVVRSWADPCGDAVVQVEDIAEVRRANRTATKLRTVFSDQVSQVEPVRKQKMLHAVRNICGLAQRLFVAQRLEKRLGPRSSVCGG
eukprot:COSAG01_NODE_17041_length_1183_cov_0.761993_2_plen_128_part_00